MHKGCLLLLLHAHLPYVRHPRHSNHLEETWLLEAVLEAYLPILEALEELSGEGTDFRVTISLSPTLLEMLSDRLLAGRIRKYLDRTLELTEKEVKRTGGDPLLFPLALMYNDRLRRLRGLYEERYRRDLLSAFAALEDSDSVELITTCATHAYLPALSPYPREARRQVRVGMDNFRKHLGHAPAGLWLPECGYYDGLDEMLGEEGVGYFFLESHGLLHARPRARHGVFRPIRCPGGPAAFGRDQEAARLVWSAESGYPGHADYRDFHRDIGLDLPMRYIGPYLPGGVRTYTGIKYHRVTGKGNEKAPYNRRRALERAARHAGDFVGKLEGRVSELSEHHGFSPLIVAPFDAELFGHWWFEGADWLRHLLRGLAGSRLVKTVTASGYLGRHRRLQRARPSLSSWGQGGYSSTWVKGPSGQALREVHAASERMDRLEGRARRPSAPYRRALAQAQRELMLAQASDWPFLISKGSHASYAQGRIRRHLDNFAILCEMLENKQVDPKRLERMERATPIFPELS